MSIYVEKAADIFYDFSASIISITDVVTDVLVTIEFYREGSMTFFGISMTILIMAQLCYTMLFFMVFGYKYRDKKRSKQILFFTFVLPLGQLVPAFLWIDSFNFKIINKIKQKLDLEIHTNSPNKPAGMDPLMWWIEKKFISHGGFLIEAIIEAFPQSINQMIYIVTKRKSTPLNVFSILLSMISVSSKTLMLSYSMHRITFIFNFLCYSGDIFGIFTTLSWVFHKTNHEITLVTWIYIIKLCVIVGTLICGVIFILLCVFIMSISDDCTSTTNNCCNNCCECTYQCWKDYCRNCRIFWKSCCKCCCYEIPKACCCECQVKKEYCKNCWKDCAWYKIGDCISGLCQGLFVLIGGILFLFGLMPAGAAFAVCIAVMLVEIIKLSILPGLSLLFVGSAHEGNVTFYKPIFNWVYKAINSKDFNLRLAVINAAVMFKNKKPRGASTSKKYGPFYRYITNENSTNNEVELKVNSSLIERISKNANKEKDYRYLKDINPKGIRKHAYGFFISKMFDGVRKGKREVCSLIKDVPLYWGFFVILAVVLYSIVIFIFIPILFLYILFSLFYPILCMILTDWENIDLLQKTLTYVYSGLLGILLLLLPSVLKFVYINIHFVSPKRNSYGKTKSMITDVKMLYIKVHLIELNQKIIEYFFEDLAPIIIGYLGNSADVRANELEKYSNITNYNVKINTKLTDFL